MLILVDFQFCSDPLNLTLHDLYYEHMDGLVQNCSNSIAYWSYCKLALSHWYRYISWNMHTFFFCFAFLWFYHLPTISWVASPVGAIFGAIVKLSLWGNCKIVPMQVKDIGKLDQYQTSTKHYKIWTVCILLGMYHTETMISSFWGNVNYWLHWKLSTWQLSVQPMM